MSAVEWWLAIATVVAILSAVIIALAPPTPLDRIGRALVPTSIALVAIALWVWQP